MNWAMNSTEAHICLSLSAPLTQPLRIALAAGSELPVPPRLCGGIERVVGTLGRGLAARGHERGLGSHPA